MDFNELTNLIDIRKYIVDTMGNPILERSTVKELNGILILLDKKIVNILIGSEFKEYIGYAGVKAAIYEAAMVTNIKSGIKK